MENILVGYVDGDLPQQLVDRAKNRLIRGKNRLPTKRGGEFSLCSDDVEVDLDLDKRIQATNSEISWRLILRLIDTDNDRRKIRRLYDWYIRRFLTWRTNVLVVASARTFYQKNVISTIYCPFRRGFNVGFAISGVDHPHSWAKTTSSNTILNDLIFSRYYVGSHVFDTLPPSSHLSEFKIVAEFIKLSSERTGKIYNTVNCKNVREVIDCEVTVYIDSDLTNSMPILIRKISRFFGLSHVGYAKIRINDALIPVKIGVSFVWKNKDTKLSEKGRKIIVANRITQAMPSRKTKEHEITSGFLSKVFKFIKTELPTSSQIEEIRHVIIEGTTDQVRKEGQTFVCPPNSVAIWDCIWESIFGMVTENSVARGSLQ